MSMQHYRYELDHITAALGYSSVASLFFQYCKQMLLKKGASGCDRSPLHVRRAAQVTGYGTKHEPRASCNK